ncbi:MAG TPA: PaaI family thioesterase [Solimonas sp.]|nr:PaaI family thioesterase [Solimonas sp.]
MTGLEQLQGWMLAGQKFPIGETLKFKLVEVEHGRARFEGVPGEHAYGPGVVVHGGYAATLLDAACACAVHSSLDAGQSNTTLELKVAYHRALTSDSGLVRAEGKLVSLGKRVAYAEARLIDSNGTLCASATSTLLVLERKS